MNKNAIPLHIVDTFADQHLHETVSIFEEEFAHLQELGLKWDKPWTLEDEWELESWEIVPGANH